ncbi:DNA polymerase III [Pseudomonas syringae pv. actinidiae]|uniref:DNA polymerase III n=1 Tax=Pseudomonas syringae pv. actinidiae TaxID=103796 RepID=A0A2V0QFD6_PSESF|nr:DNA polymerase III [Pseudomonas syringae pv. actinidiae]
MCARPYKHTTCEASYLLHSARAYTFAVIIKHRLERRLGDGIARRPGSDSLSRCGGVELCEVALQNVAQRSQRRPSSDRVYLHTGRHLALCVRFQSLLPPFNLGTPIGATHPVHYVQRETAHDSIKARQNIGGTLTRHTRGCALRLR